MSGHSPCRSGTAISPQESAVRTDSPEEQRTRRGAGGIHGLESSFAYFSSFVPSWVAEKVLEDAALGRPETGEGQPNADSQDAVVYLVDISGFSKLADRFCNGQEKDRGIDLFSSIVNSLVSEIVEHVDSWGGDIVRFVGDCVIIIWKVQEQRLKPRILEKAVQCALELERLLGTFVVPCQGQSMDIADLPELVILPDTVAGCGEGKELREEQLADPEIHYLDELELVKRLKKVPVLGEMDKKDIEELWRRSSMQSHSKGELIAVGDCINDEKTVFIVHSGIVEYSAAGSLGDVREGSIFTVQSLCDKHSLVPGDEKIALVGKADCVISQIKADDLEAITGMALGQLLEATLDEAPEGSRQGSSIILRVHQAISCGSVCFLHVGGEALNEALGPRREFLVVGPPILEASEALNDGAAGELVVGKSCRSFLSAACTHTPTARGHLKIVSAGPRELRVDVAWPPSIGSLPLDKADRVCEVLRSFCHEGSRQLCGQAESLAHDLRQLSVVFFKMRMDLQDVTRSTLDTISVAFACIQNSVQSNQGTILQFVQDDKGLIVVACFGYAPFPKHAADPLRATLASMRIHQALAVLGVPVSIGITTGAAFAGFAGNDRRRQQCVMGSTVNMAASLMCAADGRAAEGSVLVDLETKTEASVTVQFKEMPSVQAKGRDAPVRVFRPVRALSEREVRKNVTDLAQASNILSNAERAVPLLLEYVSANSHKCTVKYVIQACKFLHDRFKRFDHLSDKAASFHVSSLSQFLRTNSASNPLNSSDMSSLGSIDLCYTTSLAKVALFISHTNIFPKDLARKVFCKSLGVGLSVFEKAFAQLRSQCVIRPIMPFEAMNFSGTVASDCPDCVPWRCLGGKVCVHPVLLAEGVGENFVFVKERWEDVQEHISEPVQFNRRVWSRLSAEWYKREQKLDTTGSREQILLALKYEGSVEKVETGAKFDENMALNAAYFLSCAAQAAEDAMSFKDAIGMLQRAFNLVEHVSSLEGGQAKVAIVKKIRQLSSSSSTNSAAAAAPPGPMVLDGGANRRLSLALEHISQRGQMSPSSPSSSGMTSPSEHLRKTLQRRASMSFAPVKRSVSPMVSRPCSPLSGAGLASSAAVRPVWRSMSELHQGHERVPLLQQSSSRSVGASQGDSDSSGNIDIAVSGPLQGDESHHAPLQALNKGAVPFRVPHSAPSPIISGAPGSPVVSVLPRALAQPSRPAASSFDCSTGQASRDCRCLAEPSLRPFRFLSGDWKGI